MSIPRYKPNPLWFGMPILDAKDGKLCEYRDYVKLEAENARLKAEVERLTKAGDNLVYVVSEHPVSEPFVKAWFAAKGGNQS